MQDGVITVVCVLVTAVNAGLVLYWRRKVDRAHAALAELARLQREAWHRRGEKWLGG